MKKVKNHKKLFDTFKWTSKESETTFILVLTQSQKSLLVYTVHTLAKIKWYYLAHIKKKLIFYFLPKVPYL